MSVPDEKPETGNTQGIFILTSVLTIGVALVLTTVLYILFENRLILSSLAESMTRDGSNNGVKNVIISVLILLVLMVTIFGFNTVLPNIINDKTKQEQMTQIMRGRVIPIAATIFFVLFVYQFMTNGRDVSDSKEIQDKMGLVLIIALIGMVVQGIRLVMQGSDIVKMLAIVGVSVGMILLVVFFGARYFR